MVKCPHCGNRHSDVKDSRPTMNGCLRRRRMCRKCEYRWTTIEMSIGEDENEEAATVYFRRNVTKVHDKVQALRDALDRFLKGVTHTGEDNGTETDNG